MRLKNVKASASETSRNCEAISVIEAIVYWNALSAIIDYGNIYMSSLLFTISDTLTNNWTVNKNETLKISQTWYIFLIFRLPLDWAYFLLKTGAEIKALSKKIQILRCICAVISSQRILFSFCLRPAEEIRGAAYDNSEATAYYVKSSKLQVIRHPSASNWTAVKISNVLKSTWKHILSFYRVYLTVERQ